MVVWLYSFFTSARDTGGWSASAVLAQNYVRRNTLNSSNIIRQNTKRYKLIRLNGSLWCRTATWRWPDGDLTVTWRWPDGDLTVTWLWPDCDLTVTWRRPDGDRTVTWLWPDCDLTVTWLWPDCDLTQWDGTAWKHTTPTAAMKEKLPTLTAHNNELH
jgi:hypothetical protein